MKPLHIITLALDAMPFLPMQLATFNRLRCQWTWHVVHGAAANTGSTSWCRPQQARLSTDGTTEFLNALRGHPRVKTYQRQWWPGGKDEMFSTAMRAIREDCVLMEVDADELWSADQMVEIVRFLSAHPGHRMEFFCRYFVGPNLVTLGDNSYGNKMGEWARAWAMRPSMKLIKHEPPVMSDDLPVFSRKVTAETGLTFDHWAWVFPQQVAYKEKFYGYDNALECWQRLQRHQGQWPVQLNRYLPWVDAGAMADRLYK